MTLFAGLNWISAAVSPRIEARWVRRLAELYPGEPSVAATLLLNLVELEPGQCIRLDAGNLHGYLRGAGIELMGNSDNVIRGGLTVKHVDVERDIRRFVRAELKGDEPPTGSNKANMPKAFF